MFLLASCGSSAAPPIQGYVEGEYVRVAAPFGGTLQQLAVARGDTVSVGASVFSLESADELAARRQAQQQLAAAEARLANLRTGKRPPEIATVSDQLKEAIAALDLSKVSLKRQEELTQSGAGTSAALDDARAQWKRDASQTASLKAAVLVAKLPARAEEIDAAEADASAARASLEEAQWHVAQRAIPVATAGLVHDTYYVVGDWVPAGSPVASILPPGNVKVRFYVSETALGRLTVGQSVQVTCDGCAASVAAKIIFLSDRAEFTPPVLYSRSSRGSLVYLVEAKPTPRDATQLHVGQPVDVTLATSP